MEIGRYLTMCGIFGQFAWSGQLEDRASLISATQMLEHRGPDDGAYWTQGGVFLGHRRLSIIDIDSGQQPMASPDGRLVVTFNGEIYNYVELRQELSGHGVKFATQSDTEVLLHGWRIWGADLPNHLIGMFAFALFDRDRRCLFAARDRLGEKPLFLMEGKGRLSFASEIKALAGLADCRRAIDPEGLAGYLCLNYVPGVSTMMAGIRRIAPGWWFLMEADGNLREECFWRPEAIGAGAGLDLEEATDTVSQAIDTSVAGALRSDVPVTLFLSGGIDSSVVAESAARQGNLHEAFCLDFDDGKFSEWTNAKRVADHLGLRLNRVVLEASALDGFQSLVEHADDPLADSSALAMWTLSKETGSRYKVTLSGDGGDELFAGYLTYRATMMHRSLLYRLPGVVRRCLANLAEVVPVGHGKVTFGYKIRRFLRGLELSPGAAHFSWNGTWMPAVAARLVASDNTRTLVEAALDDLAGRHGLDAHPSLLDLQKADLGDYLPNDILVKVDRTTMAHGLESRVPLLAPAIVELALSLDEPVRLKGGEGKRVLRNLARRIYGPEISDAPKQGFSIPIHDWLRGPGRPLVLDLLSPSDLDEFPEMNTEEIIRVRDRHLSGEALGFELWGLLVLVAWHRAFVRFRAPRPSAPLRQVCV